MVLTIEKQPNLNTNDIESIASLVASGFGRPEGEHNLLDTKSHLGSADYINIARQDERLVAFTAFKRQLWPQCN